MREPLYVLAASYDSRDDALSDWEAVQVIHRHVSESRDFDATVVAKDADGKVEIVRRHDEPVSRGATSGLGWGLATGAVVALFPAVGIVGALAVGGGAGAALGAVAGHAHSAITRDDLKALGDVLDRGDAGLVVVYPREMADRVSTEITRAKHKVDVSANVSPEELAAEVRAAEEKAAASPVVPG
jgi:uncharacterized membrane protein